MVRHVALPLLVLLVGCGGRHHEGTTVLPLSSYGAISVTAKEGFNGTLGDLDFSPVSTGFVDASFILQGDDRAGSPSDQHVEITIPNASSTTDTSTTLTAGGTAIVRFHDVSSGTDRVWASTGGRLTLRPKVAGLGTLALEKVTISPVDGTGATGTAVLSGTFSIVPFSSLEAHLRVPHA